MEKYSEHKETNVFWQTMMPKHWCVMKLRYILRKLQREKKPNAELLVCSNSGRVNIKGDNKLGLVAEDDKIYQGVGKGDLLIHGMDTWHGAIAVSEYDGMCTPVVHVCDSTQNKSFVAYYLRNMAYEKVFKLISNGVRQNTSDFRCWDKLAVVPIILPPLAEQHSIVSYLDKKCSLLGTLLSNKEKEISLLQEMKQRVIADAVTRGVNPNAKFKATNIPWLPEIPEHWSLLRNKSFMRQTDEKVGKRKDITLLSLTKQGVVVRDLTEGKGKFPKDYETYLIVKPNNLVFCLFDIDETPRTVGLVRHDGMLTGAYSNFEIIETKVLPDFAYYYYLQVDDIKGLRPFYTGLRKVVKANTFAQLRVPVPPLSEQRAIVSYITERTSKIDTLIEKLTKEIECVKEYKQRLISDVVTGQVKVC